MNKELEVILDKVSKLYSKYGVKSVTMDDVSRELGISKKTLYLHVKNKSDLVSKVLDYILEKNDCEINKLKNKDLNAVEQLLEVGLHIIQTVKDHNPSTEYDLKKYYPDLHKKLHEIRRERIYESVLNNIRKGKEEDLFRNDLDDEIIAKMQTSRFVSMGQDEIFNHEDVFTPKYILEFFIYHIRGIANKKGLEILEKTLEKNDIKEYLQ